MAFRRNRSRPARHKDWTAQAGAVEGNEIDAESSEGVTGKGDLSRHRTIIIPEDAEGDDALCGGVVVAMRGLYAEVDDGQRIRRCTVRRVLRTRLIEERHAVTVGDRVRFRISSAGAGIREGVIEAVAARRGVLRRRSGRRIQTIVANVDQVVIVSSAGKPNPKPNLIDRYIVAALAGEITPVICMNKMDLDETGAAAALLERYVKLGYATCRTSIVTKSGIDALREILRDRESVIAGQSGVGKSSLLNTVQPGLSLRTAAVAEQSQKGRHTTTTASLIRLEMGGYVVDTPGIRSFDLSIIPREAFEAYFVEFVDRLAGCKFPNCLHTHEIGCAIKAAVEAGEITAERYRSYVQMFEDPGTIE